ncbi:MAG: SDR family NAD(P)-dependent oxidoreductase [Clostridia bacterium]|nr:SDR family NAD(P)-dependent oxidoreductase [Clostridia bacterium]
MKQMLITGAAGGVGSCLVREYIDRGYHVYAADIQSDPPEWPAEYCTYIRTDVSDTDSVHALAEKLHEMTDHLDIILNASGVLYEKSERRLEDFDIDAALPMYSINALGPLRVVQCCVDLLRRGEDKLLVNISSEAGSITTHADYIKRYDYCMSKCALNMQSVILQRYLSKDGIRVLLIHPGWVRTRMGGPEAPLSPEESARGVALTVDAHRHDPENGMYFDYDGSPRPW